MRTVPPSAERTIALHAAAPPKPMEGEPCNGCGVCCAMERCPMARLLLRGRGGPCPALEWRDDDRRYACGLVLRPTHYLRWLPERLGPWMARRIAYRISAGTGCDCGASVLDD